MSSALRLVHRKTGMSISVQDFIDRLSSQDFDRVEGAVRSMRETFQAPSRIADHQDYEHHLFRFYAHYFNTFFQQNGGGMDVRGAKTMGWEHLRRLKKDVFDVERDAILNRYGGFIGIINELTEAMVKERVSSYIDMMFFDYLPRGPQARLDLATELIEKLKPFFANEPHLAHPWMFAEQLENNITDLMIKFHQIKRTGRYTY